MIQLQLSSVTQQEFNPINLGTLSFVVPCLDAIAAGVENIQLFFWGAMVVSGLVFFEFVVSLFWQMARILGIKLFTIKEPTKTW